MTVEQTPKFWMVVKAAPTEVLNGLIKGRPVATIRHRTRSEAYAEAERLARKERASFIVLEALDEAIFVPEKPIVTYTADAVEWRRTRYQSDLAASLDFADVLAAPIHKATDLMAVRLKNYRIERTRYLTQSTADRGYIDEVMADLYEGKTRICAVKIGEALDVSPPVGVEAFFRPQIVWPPSKERRNRTMTETEQIAQEEPKTTEAPPVEAPAAVEEYPENGVGP